MNKPNYQHVMYGLILISLMMLFTVPDLLLEVVHIIFEAVESTLDTLIEIIFDTGLHETQVIVFYILLGIFLYFAFRLWQIIPLFIDTTKEDFQKLKTFISSYWISQSLLGKSRLIVICLGVLLLLFV